MKSITYHENASENLWGCVRQPSLRRICVLVLVAMVATSIAVLPSALRAAPKRPNIVFLLTDDQRYDSLGCNGNTIIQTPHIDTLARRGVAFDGAFVTTSICATNRACIFTGQYAARHGMWDFNTQLTPQQLSNAYPALLKSAGYRTGFIGKYGVGKPPGKDVFDYNRGFAGQGRFLLEVDGQPRHLTSVMGDQAIEFIEGCRDDQPFHLSISFKAPHVQDSASVKSDQFPHDPATHIAHLYQDITIPLPMTASSDQFERFPDFLKNSENRSRWAVRFWGPERMQQSLKGYYRLISGVDVAVGRIIEKLRETGLADNTVIIYSSDHGQFLGEYGFAGKWYPHEASIRVPLIINDPRLSDQHASRRTEMALSIDLAPTMLALAGIEPPKSMQGRSLLPILQGETPADWRCEFYYEHHFVPGWDGVSIPRSEGIRTARWKYIQYIDSRPLFEELYDLQIDPYESVNLATHAQHADRMASFREKLSAMRRSVQ